MKNRLALLLVILIVTTSTYAQRDETADTTHGTSLISGPDLIVSDISITTAQAQLQINSDGTISLPIEVTVLNQGNEMARSPFGIHISLEIAGEQMEFETIPRLSTNQSHTFTRTALLPASLGGRQINFSSTIDPPGGRVSQTGPKGGFLKETNEENNIHQVNLQLPVIDSALASSI
ncbi:MAG: hypothetical protein HKN87_10255 [Saprospiraceae bacterium]|nr:hypothetical protein [Saprospiraceae bacterium]